MSAQTAREVDDEAAAWAIRLGDDPQAEGVDAWLAGDPRRAGALLRAQAALSFVDRARALPLDAPARQAPAPRRDLSRRALIAAGGAAVVVGAAAAAASILRRPKRFSTEVGEIRRVPLQDGSVVDINTTSVLDVAMHGAARDVVLHQGEAWFQVAKDPGRPFIVASGEARFRAVGTAFSVRRWRGRSDLLVTEGVVEASLEGGGKVLVKAGSRITVSAGGPLAPVQASDEIERALAWRNGQISLEGQSLAEAAAEFNRYNRRRLIIDDPALARRQFVGLFRIDDPQSFAMAVAASSGAKLQSDDQVIRLR